MDAAELTCQELVELVTDYVEGTLPPPDIARFEAHLSGCTGCTNYVEQARRTIDLSGRLTEDSLSSTARADLLNAFRRWKNEAGSE
jgi:anti-sigma factor RsiW